jgi:hypothetical protein
MMNIKKNTSKILCGNAYTHWNKTQTRKLLEFYFFTFVQLFLHIITSAALLFSISSYIAHHYSLVDNNIPNGVFHDAAHRHYQGAFYYQNAMRFRVTGLHVIKFTPGRKLGLPYADFHETQSHFVQLPYAEVNRIRKKKVESMDIN